VVVELRPVDDEDQDEPVDPEVLRQMASAGDQLAQWALQLGDELIESGDDGPD
jgi:hypothetical protein